MKTFLASSEGGAFSVAISAERIRKSVAWRFHGVRSMAFSVWRMHGWMRTQAIPIDIKNSEFVPVILCVWHRLEMLPKTLEMLAAQTLPVQAVIWDNSGSRDLVDEIIAGASIPITVHHSDRNIGGFGRFYLARAAASSGHEAVIFIDDDAEFEPDIVADMLGAHRPRSLSGWFAFKEYAPRPEVWVRPGESAVYVGTCGMIADPAIFTDVRLFKCPRRYWFVEDLWLSHFAANHGYSLYRSPIELNEVHDGRNQSIRLGWTRQRLCRYLRSRSENYSH